MYQHYNPNPKLNRVGDCVIRAITKATGKTWEDVFAGVTLMAYMLCDMPSANHVWGAYLRREGYKRYIVDDHDQDVYTVQDFCKDNPIGTYILAIPGHVVCVSDGCYFDSWDSGLEIPQYYWKKED